jgi:hypothetical protein
MEWFLIALTSLLMVISPVGLVVDQVIDHNIRDRVKSVEELSVRVDNAPSFQIIKGKVNRVRIASRGLEPLDHVRIETLELETDPIDISLDNLKINNLQELRASLHKPLQGAIHVVMTPEDINNALADEAIKAKLQDLLNKVLPEEAPKLELVNIKVSFLENNRLQTQVQLQQKSEDSELPDQLKIVVETGIKVNQGKSLELIDPTASLNDRKISSRILKSVIGSVSDRLDLSRFENQGIIARLLKLEINPQEINIAAFIRLNPVNPLSGDTN